MVYRIIRTAQHTRRQAVVVVVVVVVVVGGGRAAPLPARRPSSRKGTTTRAKSTPPFAPPKSPRTRLVMEAAEGIQEEEGQGQGLEAEGIGSPPSRVTLAQVTGTPIGLLSSRTGSSPASHSLPPSSPFANWEQSEAQKRLSGTPLGELQEARVEIDGLHAHVRRLVIERDEHATAVLHAVGQREATERLLLDVRQSCALMEGRAMEAEASLSLKVTDHLNELRMLREATSKQREEFERRLMEVEEAKGVVEEKLLRLTTTTEPPPPPQPQPSSSTSTTSTNLLTAAVSLFTAHSKPPPPTPTTPPPPQKKTVTFLTEVAADAAVPTPLKEAAAALDNERSQEEEEVSALRERLRLAEAERAATEAAVGS